MAARAGTQEPACAAQPRSRGVGRLAWRIAVLAAFAAAACAMLAGHRTTPGAAEDALVGARGRDGLASMQGEVEDQLVEAAKRHALAEQHKTESVRLANAAQEEREHAQLLKKRAALAKREAELQHAGDTVHAARARLRKLRDGAGSLQASEKHERSQADADKERVMELEDKAAALAQKAAEEKDAIQVVESKQDEAAGALPKLLKDAEKEEAEASEMKAQARKRLADSKRKASAAKRLDKAAQIKERDAHVMRNKLMGILEQRSKLLARKEKDATLADNLAKKAAKVEEGKAQQYAEEAADKAELAKEASAESDDKQPESEVEKMLAEADAADAADDREATLAEKKEKESGMKAAHTQALRVVAPRDPHALSRKQVLSARASNLQRAALETARRRAGAMPSSPRRTQELAGVAQVASAAARMQGLSDDAHSAPKHKAFKEALAAAYRSGYHGHEVSAHEQRASEHAALRAQATEKPARLQMLGDATAAGSAGVFGHAGPGPSVPSELLSSGAGDSVRLDAGGAASSARGGKGIFSMLWTDPGSLKADTEELMGTTRHMHRYAPGVGGGDSSAASDAATPSDEALYETGGAHVSREESQFKQDMGKYRSALKQEREAHEAKVQRLDEELAQLPAAGRHSGSWRQDREAAFSTMLRQPQREWSTDDRNPRAYSHTQQSALLSMPTVHQDEDGHLVFDRRRHRVRMQELHEYARRRVRVHRDSESGEASESNEDDSREDTVRRVREELARERRRERRLEDVTQRMQGEIDVLKHEPASAGARTEDLAQVRRAREDADMRRRRIEGARGRVQRFHDRARRAARSRGEGRGHERKDFHPDGTYNKEYAWDPGHVSVGEIKFQHALKDFDRVKSVLREGAMQDDERDRLPQLIPSHLPGQGL